MRVTVLFASPKKDGATAWAVRDFLSALPDDSVIDFFDCYQINAQACIDCGVCKNGVCAFRDLDKLFASCETCDILVVAAPVYNYSVPSPLKAIFDRCQPYYYKNFTSYNMKTNPNRKGVLILTAGRSGKDAFELIRKQTDIFFKNLDITYTCERFFPHTDAADFDKSDCRTADLAEALLSDQ